MARNVILVISTLAVLLLLFVGYSSFVGRPAETGEAPGDGAARLPTPKQVADENRLQVGPVAIDPGEEMAYIAYDEMGRPTDYFRCENWEKVPGTKNDLTVTKPELMMRLPTGMIVTVTAERGQISAERVHKKRVQPKFGWLEGDARIIVDRETRFDRTPLSERPEDQITIAMEHLDFDLELGELKTADPLRVTSPDFEVSGTGLHLIWNESDNRIEKLVIEEGGRMELSGELLAAAGGSLGMEQKERGESAGAPPAESQSATPVEKDRELTAYRCTFSDGVVVDHYVGDERLGGLRGDELTLLVDIGGQRAGLPRRETGPTTAPADLTTSQPDEEPVRRLVVQWDGRLQIGPTELPVSMDQPRRQFEACGRPLLVTLPDGVVRCSRLVLHEEMKRLWLYPEADGLVELSSGDKLSAKAAAIFADLDRDIVKLIGAVEFRSRARAGGNESLTVQCDLWAELHLAAGHNRGGVEDVFDNPLASRPPEAAVFVGDVRLEYEDHILNAHRLEARFCRVKEHGAEEPDAAVAGQAESGAKVAALRAMLESVTATGDVRLIVVDPGERHAWRRVLRRNVDVLQRALVRALSPTASGETRGWMPEEDRTLQCASLRLSFMPSSREVRIRDMEATGAVQILDRGSRFAARGRRVVATFTEDGELKQATVGGLPEVPALVRARAYTLLGSDVHVDNQARTLHVDGRSTLAFLSRRSLQGLTRRRAETITVTSHRSLHIDEGENTVHFAGQVVAGTADEQLLSDSLTLVLEDEEVTRPPTAWSQLKGVVRLARGELLGAGEAAEAPRGPLVSTRPRSGDRKELAHILAYNAVIQSETYTPGDELPLVHQSVAAPELEVDVRRRSIRTSGVTKLLVTDRRLPADARESRTALGVPSALMDAGPSQTAMECTRSLVYVLGEEGPQRRDSVLLEGGVRFRRVAGREMVNLEQMLPEVASNPSFFEQHKIKDRNTYMECGRLEGVFLVVDEPGGARARQRLRPSLQVLLLHASENVYLRDQQDAAIRSVYAHQLEHDRLHGVIRVLGVPEEGIEARVYDENTQTGRFSIPAIGPEIIINLETNTIRTKQIRGQAGG